MHKGMHKGCKANSTVRVGARGEVSIALIDSLSLVWGPLMSELCDVGTAHNLRGKGCWKSGAHISEPGEGGRGLSSTTASWRADFTLDYR